MRVFNLTSEDVSFVDAKSKKFITFARRDDFQKIEIKEREVGSVYDSIVIKEKLVDHQTISLPEPEEGTIYIVSEYVAQSCPERDDFYYPDGQISDKIGRFIGFTQLVKA